MSGGRVPPGVQRWVPVRSQIQICWLATFGQLENGDPMTPCTGRIVRAHLIPKGMIKRAGGDPWDRRSWVFACGGVTGVSGHHGAFDFARTLRLPRSAIPAPTEDLAAELGLDWWLSKIYGERDVS